VAPASKNHTPHWFTKKKKTRNQPCVEPAFVKKKGKDNSLP